MGWKYHLIPIEIYVLRIILKQQIMHCRILQLSRRLGKNIFDGGYMYPHNFLETNFVIWKVCKVNLLGSKSNKFPEQYAT